MPRIGENSDKLHSTHAHYAKKYILNKTKCLRVSLVDGVATAIGEVEISDHMAYILKHRINLQQV
jgi:hypothetical protein